MEVLSINPPLSFISLILNKTHLYFLVYFEFKVIEFTKLTHSHLESAPS